MTRRWWSCPLPWRRSTGRTTADSRPSPIRSAAHRRAGPRSRKSSSERSASCQDGWTLPSTATAPSSATSEANSFVIAGSWAATTRYSTKRSTGWLPPPSPTTPSPRRSLRAPGSAGSRLQTDAGHVPTRETASSGREDRTVIEPGNSAGILVYENRWAGPFAAALRRGAQLVASGRIPVQPILAPLDQAEPKLRGLDSAVPPPEHHLLMKGKVHARSHSGSRPRCDEGDWHHRP